MTNFSDAAGRHWKDGELLFDSGRFDNADHLYGFAAECAVKSAVKLTENAGAEGDIDERYRYHIDKLWDRVPAQQLSRNFPALSALLRQQNPFSDWAASQRYQANNLITKVAVDNHRKMAQRLLGATQLLGTRTGAKNG